MGLAVVIGIAGGRYLDNRFETTPVFFWIGLGLGFGAAGKAVFDAFMAARRVIDDEPEPPKKD